MKIVEAPIGSQQSLLTSNKADIVLDIEPMVSLAESLGLKPVLSLADYYQDFAFTGITHQTSLLSTNPDLVTNFMKAINKGLKLARTDEKTSLKIAQEVFKTYEPIILKKAYTRLLMAKVWPESSDIDSKAWESARKLKE
jgi:ABC-type nitrate/sulfonate/bicarbonate transport system substrate-binding protein